MAHQGLNGEQIIKELTSKLTTGKITFLYHLPGSDHSFIKGLEEQWCPQNPSRVFIHAIDHWVQQENRTWEDVCTGLELSDNKHLANALRKKYLIREINVDGGATDDTGRLPTQSNDPCSTSIKLDSPTSDVTSVLTSDTIAEIKIRYSDATEQVNAFFSHASRDLQNEKEKVQDEIDGELKKLKVNQRKITTASHSISDLKNNLETYEEQVKTALERLKVGDYRQAYKLRHSLKDKLLSMEEESESIEKELAELKRAIPADVDSVSTSKTVMEAISTMLKLKLEPNDSTSEDYDYVKFIN